jgi:thiol:disulfide interchange protein DsbA
MLTRILSLALLLVATAAPAQLRWQQGVHYQLLPAPQRAGAPADKIEVAEVFSYGCIYCYRAKDVISNLAASLPKDAAMTYVHASFLPNEAWPMFQRAYYTARALGIADTLHDQTFQAVWETAEIPLVDLAAGRIRRPLPTIEDAAKFYARAGSVKAEEFLKVAASPAIEAEMQRADNLVKAWRVPGTPALVVNGRYLVSNSLAHTEQAQIVQFLISLERARLKKPTP